MKKLIIIAPLLIILTSLLLIGTNLNPDKEPILDAIEETISNEEEIITTSDINEKTDRAINLVTTLPEVQKWQELIDSTDNSGKAIIEVDSRDEDIYTVHVYELKDNNTATFNWYLVDLESDQISLLEFD
jgi:hypothetical protein